MNQIFRQRPQPAQQRDLLAATAHCWHCPLDQVRRPLEIRGSKSVPDRFSRQTIMLVPLAGPPVQRSYLLRLLRLQMGIKNFTKEVVVAIPVASVIQRHHKEVASLQGLQPDGALLL